MQIESKILSLLSDIYSSALSTDCYSRDESKCQARRMIEQGRGKIRRKKTDRLSGAKSGNCLRFSLN